MPPIHCSSARHSSRLGATSTMSMFGGPSTVAPQVVRPLIASKNASIGLLSNPDAKNGTAPSTPARNHDSPATAIVSLRKTCVVSRLPNHHSNPATTKPMTMLTTNPVQGETELCVSSVNAETSGGSCASVKMPANPAIKRAT